MDRCKIRTLLALVSLCWLPSTVAGQGTVSFINGPGTLISAGAPGQETLISGPPGSYYFGLLIASPGTTQPNQFTFPAVYATNDATFPGRLLGGVVPVNGWGVNTFESFLVAGWSASLGHDWDPQWLNGAFSASGFFGLSSIATGMSGGPGLPPSPGLHLFGGPTGIQTGFNLFPVPEPSVLSLGITAGALLLARLYRRIPNNRSRFGTSPNTRPDADVIFARIKQ